MPAFLRRVRLPLSRRYSQNPVKGVYKAPDDTENPNTEELERYSANDSWPQQTLPTVVDSGGPTPAISVRSDLFWNSVMEESNEEPKRRYVHAS